MPNSSFALIMSTSSEEVNESLVSKIWGKASLVSEEYVNTVLSSSLFQESSLL